MIDYLEELNRFRKDIGLSSLEETALYILENADEEETYFSPNDPFLSFCEDFLERNNNGRSNSSNAAN